MSSQAVCVRFPGGEVEFSFAAEMPKIGDTLRRGEDEWQVIDVSRDEIGNAVVTLGPRFVKPA